MNKYEVKQVVKSIDFTDSLTNPFGAIYCHCRVCGSAFYLYGSTSDTYIAYEVTPIIVGKVEIPNYAEEVYTCSEECANMYILQSMK